MCRIVGGQGSDLEPGIVVGCRGTQGGVLEHNQGVEQVAGARRALNIGQADVLVGAGGHQSVAKRLHLRGGILAGAQRGARGNGVDEQANHGFRTRQIRRTA